MIPGDVAVEEALLVLKVAFLVLLYVFIWRIVRTASRDVRLPQETYMLTPEGAAAARRREGAGRLVVLRSPSLHVGEKQVLNSAPLTAGRSGGNDIDLADDNYASARHARFEPRKTGVWVEDVGSTNGTFVNGVPLKRPRRLAPGDVIRIGETDLRYER